MEEILKVIDSTTNTLEKEIFLQEIRNMNKKEMRERRKNGLNPICSLCGKVFDDEFIYLSVKTGSLVCSECSVSCILCTRGDVELMAFKPITLSDQNKKTHLSGIQVSHLNLKSNEKE